MQQASATAIAPETEVASQEPRSIELATLLSLVCTGAGQLYNGEVGKAGMMFGVAAVSGLLFGVAALLLVIPLQIYSAVDACKSAGKINIAIQRAKQKQQAAEAAAAKLEAETISAQELFKQIDKLHRLFQSELLNAEEFAARKKTVLAVLQSLRPREPVEDFLSACIPLAKSGALSSDELKQIKALVL